MRTSIQPFAFRPFLRIILVFNYRPILLPSTHGHPKSRITMPTIILLDVSLSMCRTVRRSKENDCYNGVGDLTEFKHLANIGVETLLEYFAQNAQLEYVALLVFSSLWEIRQHFTRHHENIKTGLYDLELYDKSNIVNAVRGVLSLKLHEWAQNGPINIILVTDGQSTGGCSYTQDDSDESGMDSQADDFHDISLSELEDQFDFPCKIQVVCLSSPRELALEHSIPFYKSLVAAVDMTTPDCQVVIGGDKKNIKQSAIWIPDSDSMDLSNESVEQIFSSIAELHYKPYHATLSCGHLSSMVMISPRPTEYLLEPLKNEFDNLKCDNGELTRETFVSAINKVRLYKLNEEINICGFMPLSEVASPAVTSRHLVLPIVNNKFNETSKAEQILSQDPNAYKKSVQTCGSMNDISEPGLDKLDKAREKIKQPANELGKASRHAILGVEPARIENDITKQPSFCVLLHNGLKQENMVAICIVGRDEESNDEWYGVLHSHTDSKKRSGLMLSLLIPGPSPILWLPSFKNLGSAELNADLPLAIRDKIASSRGPLKSYSSNSVIWLDPESVQADVQKIVRHAKRSPDKAPHFYKELNRIRRAAISYGFYDVLFGLAAILEREKRIMTSDTSKGANHETLAHIDNVIACLRESLTEESYEANIGPNVISTTQSSSI